MKPFTIALTALAMIAVPASAGEEKSSKQAVKTPKVAKIVEVKAPFDNHWSANSWEEGSQQNFWTATTSESKQPKKQD